MAKHNYEDGHNVMPVISCYICISDLCKVVIKIFHLQSLVSLSRSLSSRCFNQKFVIRLKVRYVSNRSLVERNRQIRSMTKFWGSVAGILFRGLIRALEGGKKRLVSWGDKSSLEFLLK